MNRFAGLDLLRVIAGLALIVCHTAFLLSSLRIPDSVWLYLGLVGVEIFLVSLGFLLTCRMPEYVAEFAGRMAEFSNGGIGLYDTFTHLDVRKGKSRWDYRTSQ